MPCSHQKEQEHGGRVNLTAKPCALTRPHGLGQITFPAIGSGDETTCSEAPRTERGQPGRRVAYSKAASGRDARGKSTENSARQRCLRKPTWRVRVCRLQRHRFLE
ncbi:hypothetical protein BDZ85DRAFT_270606 [Elsinoe ampelina]|uniref:Uncharacterized protein n=1 Tax=Elsinoe ampelina TaxID=302913 RepID=A0A6A6FY50_9PEZI|nr:hypothetical protein BDZ85DRAFT_270606 [Elsinoe ampelina]